MAGFPTVAVSVVAFGAAAAAAARATYEALDGKVKPQKWFPMTGAGGVGAAFQIAAPLGVGAFAGGVVGAGLTRLRAPAAVASIGGAAVAGAVTGALFAGALRLMEQRDINLFVSG